MWPYLHRRFPLWTDASAGAIRSGVATDGSLPLTSYDPIEASVGSKAFEEEVIIKSFVLSDFAAKTAYFSLAAAAVVFLSMLLLTRLHPLGHVAAAPWIIKPPRVSTLAPWFIP